MCDHQSCCIHYNQQIICVCMCVHAQAWDDVEHRVKPPVRPFDYSRSRPLDQEKSKMSLAEVYEQEYIKQTLARWA